jgi:hypothetical protein
MDEVEKIAADLAAVESEYGAATASLDDAKDAAGVGGRLAWLAARAAQLRDRLATARADAVRIAVDRAERIRLAGLAEQRAELETQREALTVRWLAWGAEMSALDAALNRLWPEYYDLAQAALVLANTCRERGFPPDVFAPDPGKAANAVLQRITSGASGVKDRHVRP